MKHAGPMVTNLVDYSEVVSDEAKISQLLQEVKLAESGHNDKNVNILQKLCNEKKGKSDSWINQRYQLGHVFYEALTKK